MIAHVGLGLLVLLVIVAARRFGSWTRLPSPVILTVVGLIYALLPGRNLELDPEFVLDILIPPLLYSTALDSSLLALRRNIRPVVSLSVVLVLVTTTVVGLGFTAIVPGLPVAAGMALGAAVAPPDPVSALAIGRRAGMPSRLLTLIEGEGLLNDATALTTYQVAVAAAVAGTGLSLPAATGKFLEAAAGGLFVGALIGWLLGLARPLLRDPLIANAVSLGTPFAAYIAGESIHVSGVLAVVVTGLIVGHNRPKASSGAGRLQTTAVWQLVEFLLEGFVFLLIGQQLPSVIRGLDAYDTSTVAAAAVVTVAAVLLVRPAYLVLTNLAPRSLHARLGGDPANPSGRVLTPREIVALSWAGTRGVISLAVVFAIPLTVHGGAPFPGRTLILFCAYLVVLVTLVGQGVSFAPVLRRLGVRANLADAVRLRNEAREAAVEAALARLDEVAEEESLPEPVVNDMRQQLRHQRRRYRARLDSIGSAASSDTTLHSAGYQAAVRARRSLLDAQHEELLRWRDTGRLGDRDLRTLQTELDLQERILPDRR